MVNEIEDKKIANAQFVFVVRHNVACKIVRRSCNTTIDLPVLGYTISSCYNHTYSNTIRSSDEAA